MLCEFSVIVRVYRKLVLNKKFLRKDSFISTPVSEVIFLRVTSCFYGSF